MRSLGQFPDEEEIEEMVDDADEDGSGSVNFQEFVQLMLKRQEGGQTREEIKQVGYNKRFKITLSEGTVVPPGESGATYK